MMFVVFYILRYDRLTYRHLLTYLLTYLLTLSAVVFRAFNGDKLSMFPEYSTMEGQR